LARPGRARRRRTPDDGTHHRAVPAVARRAVRDRRRAVDRPAGARAHHDDAADAPAGGAGRAEGSARSMTRADAVADVAGALRDDALVVACNGMIGRELYTRADAPTRFYMIGSMGLASSIGLGVALVQPARVVVVFDGDGNLLMNLGGLANVAAAG